MSYNKASQVATELALLGAKKATPASRAQDALSALSPKKVVAVAPPVTPVFQSTPAVKVSQALSVLDAVKKIEDHKLSDTSVEVIDDGMVEIRVGKRTVTVFVD